MIRIRFSKTYRSLPFFVLLLFMSVAYHRVAAQRIVVIDERKSIMPNEPSIYIHPKNDKLMIAGSNINNFYLSKNGGKTWKKSALQSSLGVWGDPVLFADSSGTIYFSHLSKTPGKSNYAYIDRIVVQRSTDLGRSFNDGAGVGYNGSRVQDKQWMSADDHSSKFKGRLYLSWTEFDKYQSKHPDDHSRIRFSYSSDQGQSFKEAITVSDTFGDCLDDDNTLEGATTAICASGRVLMTWAGYENIYLDASDDGGVTWGKDRIIAQQPGGWVMDIPHVYRSNGLPFLVSDLSGGPYHGRVYLLWGSTASGNADIWMKYSDDEGVNWSEKQHVNSIAVGDTSSQFLGHISVDRSNGFVYAVYYDRKHSENNLFTDVYVAMSKDGGVNFSHHRITPESFAPPGKEVFFGDYNGIAARNGHIRPIWTQTQSGKGLSVRTALFNEEPSGISHSQYCKVFIHEGSNGTELLLHYRFKKEQLSGTVHIKRRWKTIGSSTAFAHTQSGLEHELRLAVPELIKGQTYRLKMLTNSGNLRLKFRYPISNYPFAYIKRALRKQLKERKQQKKAEKKW